MKNPMKLITSLAVAVALAGCDIPAEYKKIEAARPIQPTPATSVLENLPPPRETVFVAVYDFPDLTGQNKPNSDFAEFSRAVTQGGSAVLMDTLEEVGDGTWFSLVERRGLNNVLRERQLISATREQFEGEDAEPLPPLNFAGVLLEGGIVSYDSNIATGGVGAKYLGVGGNTEFSIDQVTVNLRAVSVLNGRILASVTTTKTIYSALVQGSVFRFVANNELFELEAGVTENEPQQFALREAIEIAVYSLIMEGADKKIWSFKDRSTQDRLVKAFQAAKVN
jgi:curli production assembly/transport component CsgG